MFGEEGNGFMRMNIGCPRSTIETALNSLNLALLNKDL
jgi:Bifunctional PLP-dependent enzyme with beta-cystathionase and maltose regulon repressor activities